MAIARHTTALLLLCIASSAFGQTTQPANPSADDMFRQLLAPQRPTAEPLVPEPATPKKDATTVKTVAPGSRAQALKPEGMRVFDQKGRLNITSDGKPEFVLEADGRPMQDPPYLILPNLKLMQMESAVKMASGQVKFVVTGMLTEYQDRNYILIEKVVVSSGAGVGAAAAAAAKQKD